MVESGPASGVLGAAELGRLIGEPNVLALDIGGTTAKCSLIEDGRVRIITDYWIERSRRSAGYPIMVPVVDLVEIGRAAAASPGSTSSAASRRPAARPARCPARRPTGAAALSATTTDANLALGRINARYFCGGELEADMDAVADALDEIALRLDVARVEAARGVSASPTTT